MKKAEVSETDGVKYRRVKGWQFALTMPQPTDPKTMLVLIMGVFLVYVVPILGWVCTLVVMKFTPFSKKKMVEVQKKIAEMKEKSE